jgi:hypothetical protein
MDHRMTRRSFVRMGAGVALGAGLGSLGQVESLPVFARQTIKTRADESFGDVAGEDLRRLPFAASHVAAYWDADHDATVFAAFSSDGVTFGPWLAITHDEVGEHRADGRTYGAVMSAAGAVAVRIRTDRHLFGLRLVAMVDGERTVSYRWGGAQAAVASPPVIPRGGWGCDESLMTWSPQFYPVQKLICHHTATQNRDPDPAATIRSIYYYHAVTQGWGDIGYNFLVDEAGRIYEGRYSRPYAAGRSPTGEDAAGRGVTGAHASQFNSGTVGIALLGTLTSQDTTAAGRKTIEQALAWKASAHRISATGSARYTNPVTNVSTTFPNIAGHRDVNATECPGGAFYASLPRIRSDVATLMGGPVPTPTPTPTATPTPTPRPTSTPTPTPGNDGQH